MRDHKNHRIANASLPELRIRDRLAQQRTKKRLRLEPGGARNHYLSQVTRAMLSTLKHVWNSVTVAAGLSILILLLGGCVSCFGLPSLAHQPSATHFYDLPVLPNGRWTVHPTDRLIARAADVKCVGSWHSSGDFFIGDGRDTYQVGRRAFPEWVPDAFLAWAYAPSGSGGRRGRAYAAAYIDTDLVLSSQEELNARGLRAALRARELDISRLRAWMDEYCPVDRRR